jgi:hypothetical protein
MSSKRPIRKAFDKAGKALKKLAIEAEIFTVDRNVPTGQLPNITFHLENFHSTTTKAVRSQNRKMELALEEAHTGLLDELAPKAKPTKAEKAAAKQRKANTRHLIGVALVDLFDEHMDKFWQDEDVQRWMGADQKELVRDWFFAMATERPRKFMRENLLIERPDQLTFSEFTDSIGIWVNNAHQVKDLAEQAPATDKDEYPIIPTEDEAQQVNAANPNRSSSPSEWDITLTELLNRFGPEPGEDLEDYLERVMSLFQCYADHWEQATVAEYNETHSASSRVLRVTVGK